MSFDQANASFAIRMCARPHKYEFVTSAIMAVFRAVVSYAEVRLLPLRNTWSMRGSSASLAAVAHHVSAYSHVYRHCCQMSNVKFW